MTLLGRHARSRLWLATAIAAVALALVAAPGQGAAATASAGKVNRVKIEDFAFKPKTLRIKRGAAVTFKNLDGTRHTATRRGKGKFDTGTLRRGQSKTIRFKRRGTFRFLCTFHPFMRGKIVVK